jgi:hypothetical protein
MALLTQVTIFSILKTFQLYTLKVAEKTNGTVYQENFEPHRAQY